MQQDVPEEFLQIKDEYLRKENEDKSIVDYKDLTPVTEGTYLWQGDISSLKCGVVVNAANSRMLGCFRPNHSCIDNSIRI